MRNQIAVGLAVALIIATGLAGISGCSGSKGSGPIEAATIEGNIYNTPTAWNKITIFLARLVSPDSATAQSVGPIRLPDITRSQMIELSTVVTNTGNVLLTDVKYEIEIEDATLATPENWICFMLFYSLDGSGGNIGVGVWTDYLLPLAECPGGSLLPAFNCDPIVYNCANPRFEVRYTPPGDGLYHMNGQIKSLALGAVSNLMSGRGNSGIDVRPDHKARWIVKKADGTELHRQEYVFNVLP